MHTRNHIPLSLLLLFFTVVSAGAEQVANLKVIGNAGKTGALFDGMVDRNNFLEFDLKNPAGRSLVLLLEKPAALKSLRLSLVEPVPQMEISVDFSSDLFNWQKAGSVRVKAGSRKGTRDVDVALGSKTALFVRIGFASSQPRMLRVSEVRMERDASASVKNVRVSLLAATENSLSVRLVADADVIASVKYGESLADLADGPVIANFGREHVLAVGGLLKGTDYYVVATGQDCNGNLKYSQPALFRTAGVPLPRIRSVDVSVAAADSLRCSFGANVESAASVSAGYAPESLRTFQDSVFSLKHRLFFTNLMQEREFFFRIRIEDRAGNRAESGLLKARTKPGNLGPSALITGDFKYVGESIGPELSETASGRLVDGDFSYMNGSAMSGDILSADQELVFDLGESRMVGRIDLVWWALAYGTDFAVYAGQDGKTWSLVKDRNVPDHGIKFGFIVNIPYLVARVPVGRNARFLRLVFKQGEFKARFPQYRTLRILEVFIVPGEVEKPDFGVLFGK